jgi:hypothetical protein
MKFHVHLVITAWFIASAFHAASAAEPTVLAQDLVKVRESGKLMAALWTRRSDSYTLQLVYGSPLYRGSFFIGNNIENSRNVDPVFGRTLTLIDGRRMAQQPASPAASASEAKAPAQALQPAIPEFQVWLLKANGTQVLPSWRSPAPLPQSCGGRCIAGEVLYRFPLAEGAEAVAAVVRIGEEYFLDKLQPLEQIQK